jgi:hypothetical protein
MPRSFPTKFCTHSLFPVDGEINEKDKEMLERFLSCPHKEISAVGDVCVRACVYVGGETEKISFYTEQVTVFHTMKFQSPLIDCVLHCHHHHHHHKRSVNAGR